MYQHPVFQVIAQAARQHGFFDVFAITHHVFRRIGVVDADDVLLNDRAGIEFAGDVMAGRTNLFGAAFISLVLRLGTGKAREEGVVNVDDATRERSAQLG